MLSIEPGLTIGGISRWCERIVDGIFREPANALSNLGFMISGLLMFKVLSDEKKRDNQEEEEDDIGNLYLFLSALQKSAAKFDNEYIFSKLQTILVNFQSS